MQDYGLPVQAKTRSLAGTDMGNSKRRSFQILISKSQFESHLQGAFPHSFFATCIAGRPAQQ